MTSHGPTAGFSIGMLVLDTKHRLSPGNLQNAASFSFPILYHVVRDISGPALMHGDPAAAEPIVAGARILESQGVQAIVGACGSFANYQTVVAGAVKIPVFMSILLEVPLLLRTLPPKRALGIVFAKTVTFTERVRHECGIQSTERIVALGADGISAFQTILAQRGEFDDAELQAGLVTLIERSLAEHPHIGAWLLQCSDLPPYAHAIARATGLPVFDMIGLIHRIHAALSPRAYTG
jgi:hypothetical protein